MSERRLALISGAGRGIGRCIALRLAEEGMDLALIYAGNDEAAEKTRQEAEELGVKARRYRCDVAHFGQCEAVVKEVERELGKVSVLINNAGVTRDMLLMRMKDSDFTRVVDVNLTGAFNLIRLTAPAIIRAGAGRIINISSVVGLHGNAGQANYAASKAGLIGLTKSVAREFAGRGVTCNAIAPGYIETDMTQALPESKRQAIIDSIPLKRTGRAQEVAELVAFLASDKGAYITGAVIPIDGGMGM